MFGTLRYVSQNNNPSYVTKRTGDRPPGRRGSNNSHSACERCRTKKLRCSGQKEGCNRCKGLGSSCSYPESSTDSRGSKNREKETRLGGDVGNDGVASNANGKSPAEDPESTYMSLSGMENTSRIDYTLDNILDSGNLRPPSPSADQSNSLQLVDWSSKSDSQDDIGSFSPEDLQYFDTDLLMSDISMSDYFNLGSPRGEDKVGEDSASNPSNYTPDLGYKPLPASPLACRNQQTNPREERRSYSIYPNNTMERNPRISHSDPPSQKLASPRAEPSHHALAKATGESCHCLQTTVSMLEEIDLKTADGRYSPIDVAMNFHQDALNDCTYVLSCRNCTSRPERMMLMTMIAEKLANLCEKTSVSCLESIRQPDPRAHPNPNPTCGEHHPVVTTSRSTTEMLPHKPQLATGASYPFEAMFCGRYRIGRSKDWAHLMRMVIILQVKALCDFLKRIKAIMSIMPRRESHVPKVDACEERARKIIESMWRSI